MSTMKDILKRYTHIAQDLSDGQTGFDDLLRKRRVRASFPAEMLAADTGENTILTAEHALEVLSVEAIPDNALTAHDTNYATLEVGKADGAGGAVTAWDSFTTKITGGSGDWVQGVPELFTIVPATDTLAVGEALMLVIAKAGTGVAIPNCLVEVEYRLL